MPAENYVQSVFFLNSGIFGGFLQQEYCAPIAWFATTKSKIKEAAMVLERLDSTVRFFVSIPTNFSE